MATITTLDAIQILDSRSYPTLAVQVGLADGTVASAEVPSGISTSGREAVELRDGDVASYGGLGVDCAVRHVNEVIAPVVLEAGLEATDQAVLDRLLIDLDGTANKERLGANAILGVSMAVAKAAAGSLGIPLWRYVGGLNARQLPVPLINVINGGCHADNGLPFEEFMVVPAGAPCFAEALRYGAEVYHALGDVLAAEGLSTSLGDDGGFAPELSSVGVALDLMLRAIGQAGFEPGQQVFIALDAAAGRLYEPGGYRLAADGPLFSSEELAAWYEELTRTHPIISIEDGMSEHDWYGWHVLTESVGRRIQLVGDDLFVTNVGLLRRGIAARLGNALLVRPNQIGTLTETIDAASLALRRGYQTVLAHRAAETSEASIADLAVGLGAGQIKAGAPCRGERIAKYNRLLRIEREMGDGAVFAGMTVYDRRPTT